MPAYEVKLSIRNNLERSILELCEKKENVNIQQYQKVFMDHFDAVKADVKRNRDNPHLLTDVTNAYKAIQTAWAVVSSRLPSKKIGEDTMNTLNNIHNEYLSLNRQEINAISTLALSKPTRELIKFDASSFGATGDKQSFPTPDRNPARTQKDIEEEEVDIMTPNKPR